MTQKSSPDPENRYVRASESCALLKKAYWVMVSRCPCLKYDQSGNQRAAADAAEAREPIFVAVVLERRITQASVCSWGVQMQGNERSTVPGLQRIRMG